jgi:hypothetical protein
MIVKLFQKMMDLICHSHKFQYENDQSEPVLQHGDKSRL